MVNGESSHDGLHPVAQAAAMVAGWLAVLGLLGLVVLAPRIPYLELLPFAGAAAGAAAVLLVVLVPTRLVSGRLFGLLAVGLALGVTAMFGGLVLSDATARSEGARWYAAPLAVELPEELPEVVATPLAEPTPGPPTAATGAAPEPSEATP